VVVAGRSRDRSGTGGDVLSSWAEKLSGRAGERARGMLRFAFYGRVSTEDWQDPVTSRARQLQQALMLAAGVGVITAEFFDTGSPASCRGPGARRPLLWLLSSRIRSGAGMRS
jgi:site-specific DNA recombinase